MNEKLSTAEQELAASTRGGDEPAIGHSTSVKVGGAIAAAVVVIAVAVGAYAFMRVDTWGTRGGAESARFDLDLSSQTNIDPALMSHVEVAKFDIDVEHPHVMAVGPGNTVYVAGDREVVWYRFSGETLGRATLDKPATALAVAGQGDLEAGKMYVASGGRVAVHASDGELLRRWPELEPKSLVTAIVLAADNVFLADAGQRVVLRMDREGHELGRIGAADPDRAMPAFIIPSPCFDMLVGDDEQVLIVNPGMRRIEAYSYDGQLQSYWGQAGATIRDFFGCCNPAHIARLADGRFVTSEKGIPRVKIYTTHGDFESVVAGPSELGVSAAALGDARGSQSERVFDVAVGEHEEILVLDTRKGCLRLFQSKTDTDGEAK